MHDNRWEGEKEQEKEKEDKTKREEKAKKKKKKEEEEVVQDAKPPTTDKVRFFIWINNCLNLQLICFLIIDPL